MRNSRILYDLMTLPVSSDVKNNKNNKKQHYIYALCMQNNKEM